MRQRMKGGLRRKLLAGSRWNGEDEALRMRLRNLIFGDDSDERGYFEDAELGETPPLTPVRTFRGLIHWASPAETDDGPEEPGAPRSPGHPTVH